MERSTHPSVQTRELFRFLRRALSRLRWGTLVLLLLITAMQPAAGRFALPTWGLVLAFAVYNLAVELLRRRWSELRSFVWVSLVDLPMAGLLYFLAGEPGGPLFVLFFLAVDSAAASLSLRGTLLYTAAAGALAAVIDPTLPLWDGSMEAIRQLAARLVMLGLVAVGMAIVTRRLTMEHETARAGQGEAERLAALDALRANFIASISHDLRTPLTAARAGLGLLDASAGERLAPDERSLLSTGRRNIDHLGMLIDDLLAYNQLEAGALQLERVPLDLRVVVTDAMATVHPLLREKGQTLEVDLPLPLPVLGDSRRLGQVVINVIANAHQHTPEGTRIAVGAQVDEGVIRLAIHDNGPGIAAQELEAIYGRFYRRGPSDGGSGLGLAIARALVELHGGRIWTESAAGAGTTFTITLPTVGGTA